MAADIVSIYSDHSSAKNLRAETEMFDYLIWSMKHSNDPHNLYDDPIEAFRKVICDNINVA